MQEPKKKKTASKMLPPKPKRDRGMFDSPMFKNTIVPKSKKVRKKI